ncbi:MAG: stage 0 sporulation family protein [Clostridia bacterium]|nr:stage 0 sporulation family protein [Clostridia bacterium]
MKEIIGVKFRQDGKVYSFAPDGRKYEPGDMVMVNTARGLECGEVASGNKSVDDSQIVGELKSVVRPATKEDLNRVEQNRKKEKQAMEVCEQKIVEHGLDMHLVDVELSFDGSKMLFYFTADGRIDFRNLVKDLAATFHTRIELRQIGVRDEAKMLGGLGICGQPFCCSRFLNDFHPVSIKMAKEQGLSLNPTKISGTCGRLMCCLQYEHDAYSYLISLTPKIGSLVMTEDGEGTVVDHNLITGKLAVKLKNNEMAPIWVYRDKVEVLRNGKGKVVKQPNEDKTKA